MKAHKTIRFEDTILNDVDAFAGRYKLKEQDGSYDFSQAIHLRYSELLQKERDFDMAKSDLDVYKNRAAVAAETHGTYCEFLHEEVSPGECRACMEHKLRPGCPKLKPKLASPGKNYYGET